MDEEDVGAAARAAIDGGGVPGDIAALAPFMAEEDVGALARTFIKRGETRRSWRPSRRSWTGETWET